ncbi:MAG: hypothetical protein KKE23_04500 [Nanoarchaeota archaeon]|nr:hypothetical protein [Nanoarchaeota archaeon]
MEKTKTNKIERELENIARGEIIKGRFDGDLKVTETHEKPHFSAGIDSNSLTEIKIRYNPEYCDENEQGEEKAKEIIKSISRHEVNHKKYEGFNGCPRTVENHAELIIEPIASVLSKKGFSHSDFHYCANALEDVIENNDLASGLSLKGMSLFWEDQGEHSEKKKYTEFYDAFVSLNLYLFGTKEDKKMLRPYFSSSKKAREVVQSFIKRAGLDMKQDINGKEAKDRTAIRQYLNNNANWQETARIFAEEFSRLMKPGYALPLINHSGKGTKGHKSDQNQEGKADPEDSENECPEEGNPFDRQMYSPDFKRKTMERRHNAGEGKPSWMSDFESMDYLYQALAKKLNIKAETYTKKANLPISWYGKRQFNPNMDSPRHLSIGQNEQGEVSLQKRRQKIVIPLDYKTTAKGFPEARMCFLDTSGSMKEDPNGGDNVGNENIIPWGDNSKYHYALLGWYGLLEYLKSNHLLHKNKVSLANFSDRTLIGEGLEEAKKMALRPQWQNTYLDIGKTKKMLYGKGNLIFTISDGNIGNWNDIKEEFMENARNHKYFHLQIGRKNQTCNDLENAGLRVEYIKNAKDLANKVIDLSDQVYRSKEK